MKPTQIARRLGTTLRSVDRWFRVYRRNGREGLKAKPSPGRPSHLSTRQKRELGKCVLKGASACGFSTDLWTSRRILEVIQRRYRVTYHLCAIPRLMASICFSPSEAAMPRPGAR